MNLVCFIGVFYRGVKYEFSLSQENETFKNLCSYNLNFIIKITESSSFYHKNLVLLV